MGSAEDELLGLHDQFCAGFANRSADVVLGSVSQRPDLVVVTSEDAILHGIDELEAFLERYASGPTTYSWAWDRRDATIFDTWGWLLAIGTESATGEDGPQVTPYRMTLVAERIDDRWAVVHVHGSSPHHP